MRAFRYLIITVVVLFASYASAHFGIIMPSDDIVSGKDNKKIIINLKFIHPFEQKYMNLEKPKAFGVMVNGKKHDLMPQLKEKKIKGFMTWKAEYAISQSGDHIFYMEPAPYWEPSEEIFIIHYTKVIVNAFGKEDAWDSEVGLKTEIVPLTRPYGLWAGNVFQGIVKVNGKPVPFANVEVEYYNDSNIKASDDAYITQVIKADANGVFTYAMPRAGWWGFAALNEADYKLKRNGKEYPVEIGAVLWVKTREMKK
jgi:cobalt/nickel transport protein